VIQLFLFPTLLAALLIAPLFVLSAPWRNALIWILAIIVGAAWGQYFDDSSKPGHDGGAGEALGLVVMAWVTIIFVLGSVLSVWVRLLKRKQLTTVLPHLQPNSRVYVVDGKLGGQAGYIVGFSHDREKGDYLVALDTGFDVILHANDLSADHESNDKGIKRNSAFGAKLTTTPCPAKIRRSATAECPLPGAAEGRGKGNQQQEQPVQITEEGGAVQPALEQRPTDDQRQPQAGNRHPQPKQHEDAAQHFRQMPSPMGCLRQIGRQGGVHERFETCKKSHPADGETQTKQRPVNTVFRGGHRYSRGKAAF
jgi:hypothetical protein